MKTQKGSVVIIVLVILVIIGGGYWYVSSKMKITSTTQVQEEEQVVTGEETTRDLVVDKSSNDMSTEQAIIKRSDQIISLLKNKSVISLKDFVHPTKGVRISSDGYIDEQRDVIVKASEIDSLIKNDTKLLWGYSDGKGDAINLSLEDYFSKYLGIDFTKSQKTYKQVVRGGSNTILDIQGVYANHNFVNYYIPYNSTYMDEGVEKPQTMDWRAINLVFEEYNGELYLIGIISDNWTI